MKLDIDLVECRAELEKLKARLGFKDSACSAQVDLNSWDPKPRVGLYVAGVAWAYGDTFSEALEQMAVAMAKDVVRVRAHTVDARVDDIPF